MNEGARPSTFTARAQNAAIVVLLGLYLAIGWQARFPPLLGATDEMVYWSLSRSLESGSYREVFQSDAPRHVLYPPGYPSWLIGVRSVVGERLDLVPGVNLALVALGLLLLTLAVRRLVGGGLAIGFLLVVALNPSVMAMGGSALSESLFFALSSACLCIAPATADRTDRRVYVVIVLALLAFLTRLVGLALVLAVGVWVVSRRRRAELVAYAVSAAIVVGGWFTYVRLVPAVTVHSYARDFVAGAPTERPTAALSMVRRMWNNSVNYGTRALPTELALPTLPETLIDNLFWVAILVATFAASLWYFWTRWRALAAFLVGYAGILIVWAWPVNRFLWPIVPFAMLALLVGAERLSHLLPARFRGPSVALLVALIAVGAIAGARRRFVEWSACDHRPSTRSPRCYTSDVLAMLAAADYVRDRTAPGDVVLAAPAAAVNFVSGRLTTHASFVERIPPSELAAAFRTRGIRYVLLTARTPLETGPLAHALSNVCAALRVEARFPESTLLFRFEDPDATATNACVDVAEFRRMSQSKFRDSR